MSDELFRVVFDGSLTGDFHLAEAKKRFAKLFRLNKQKTDALFSGKEYVIKNKVFEAEAMKFMIRVAEAGCECYIQEIPDDDDLDYEEKRESGERRLRFRRGPRAGAIVGDRRLAIRRTKDRKYFLDLSKHNGQKPLAFQSYSPALAKE
jgi:hypothetical protein